MKPIDRAGIEALPVMGYGDVRREICPGDILLCCGDYAISRAIRYMTKSPWSHAGLILPVWKLDRILLLEAVEHGVRLSPLSRRLWGPHGTGVGYRGAMAIVRHRKLATVDTLDLGLQFALDALTLPYSYRTIGRIFWRIAMGVRISDAEIGEGEFICSELVEHCLSHSGVTFDASRTPGEYITPGDIWLDPEVELVGRVA